jgi:hypothetical protein
MQDIQRTASEQARPNVRCYLSGKRTPGSRLCG